MRTKFSCRDVWQNISDYIDGELSAGVQKKMDLHIKKCTNCTTLLKNVKTVIELLSDDTVAEMPKGFSERLYKRLRTEITGTNRRSSSTREPSKSAGNPNVHLSYRAT
jgi:anti-sigma factor RsiW